MNTFTYVIYGQGNGYFYCAKITSIGEPLKSMRCKLSGEICNIIPVNITEVYNISVGEYLDDNQYSSTLLFPVNDEEALMRLPCILEFDSESSAKLFIEFGLDKYK